MPRPSIGDKAATEMTQARQIERAKREWEVTVDTLPQLVCLLDHHKQIIRANRTVERWQLGQVVKVRGQDIHCFLHPDCNRPDCYLYTFLNKAWTKLDRGEATDCEAWDEILGRYLHLQIQPILLDDNGTEGSFAVLVLEDITRQKEAEAALQTYAQKLEARNEELDAFAHTVAHNLKGPLTPIIGYAELLEKSFETMPAEILRKDLQAIVVNGHKMGSIVDELLLLAGVRKMRVEMEPIDMGRVVVETLDRLAFMIQEYQAEIVAPETWPVALGYAPWIEEVWTNYISNGLKYGGDPPRLKLGADAVPDHMIRFWVQDNGNGLQPEELKKLFQPFTRLVSGTGGHGLGLSIVQRIVDRLGGTVAVESEGIPGQGCIFSFTLPASSE